MGDAPYDLDRLAAGIDPDSAITIFLETCNKRDTLFITEAWITPRMARVRQLWPSRLTRSQAEALRDVLMKRIHLDEMIERLELESPDWRNHREASEDPRAKRFKSMRHLWLGAPAVYREPPLVAPTRIDRIDVSNHGMRVYHTFTAAPGFAMAQPVHAEASATWEMLSYDERHWHAMVVNWSLYFGDGLVHDFCEFAASLVREPGSEQPPVDRLLTFLYERARTPRG
jgi:hypothetical protein